MVKKKNKKKEDEVDGKLFIDWYKVIVKGAMKEKRKYCRLERIVAVARLHREGVIVRWKAG